MDRRLTNRGEGGFTLVELLVVVAILAVLVAIVMANFSGLLSGSQTTAASAELNIVQTAVDVKMAAESLTSVTAITTATNTAAPRANVASRRLASSRARPCQSASVARRSSSRSR